MEHREAESERHPEEQRGVRAAGEPAPNVNHVSTAPLTPADPSEDSGVVDRDIVSAVLDTVEALVVVLDTEGRIVRLNRACERTTGYAAAEVVGRRVWDLFLPPQEMEPVKAIFTELRDGAYPLEHENTWVTREGDRRRIAWSNTALRGDGGEVAFVIATGIDITERRQAEQEIERLARFPGENPNPVLRVARDGSVLYANQASSPLLDVWGSQVGQRLPDEWRRFALDVLRSRERGVAEVAVGERTLALSFAPIVEHGYVNVYGLDITARKRAQETLRRSEERYALAESAADIGSWDWDIESGDLHWSARIEPMFGFDPGGFDGTYETFLARIHPEDREDVVDAVDAAVSEDADYTIDHRVVWPDGTVRWVAETGDVIRDGSGQAVRMLGVVRDVTERKETQALIQEQNAFLTSILESVTHPLYVVDANDYTVRMANSAAYADPLPEGATCYSLFHHRHTPCSEAGGVCPLQEIKRSKRSVTTEHVHHNADGDVRTVEVRGYPLFDDEGEVTAVIEYCLDITERKELEQALRAAKETAEEARREERRRREEADRRRQIAESLTEVLAALNSNRPVEQVLDYIAGQATQLLDTQAVAICQVTSAPESVSLKASHCLPGDPADGSELPVGTEAMEQAVAERQVVTVPDLTARATATTPTAQEPPSDACTGAPFGALLAAPIVVQDEVYGGTVLYYREPRTFSDEDIELATLFSSQIARAVGNARLREQIEEAAATAERNRLARDLHDSVTQVLFSASLVAETLPHMWERNPDEAREGLEELRDLTYGALAEMRTLLLELRPSALLETGLDDLLLQLSQAVTSRAQLPMSTHIAPTPPLPEHVQVAFYRVAQEALNNAVKHAEAGELTVSLRVTPPLSDEREQGWEGQLVLRVSDDGQGFETDQTPVAGLGLGIMRERAEAIGASLSIESQLGRGTDVVLAWEGSQPSRPEKRSWNRT